MNAHWQRHAFDIRTLPKAVRALLVVIVFGLVGPPVGGIVAWLEMGAPTLRSPVPFVSGSFGEGIVLAVATGILVVVAAWFGRTSWLVACGAALLTNIAMHVGSMAPDVDGEALLRTARVFLPPSIAAALMCWWLTRGLLRS